MRIDGFITKGDGTKRIRTPDGKLIEKPGLCEDYIEWGEDWIILSDGCSSSLHTDIGAKLLVRSAVQELKYIDRYSLDREFRIHHMQIIDRAATNARLLGLDSSALDATLVVAIVHEGTLRVFGWGDYVIGWLDQNENAGCIRVEFEYNAPFYLSYFLNQERLDKYPNKRKTLIRESEDKDKPATLEEDIKKVFVHNLYLDEYKSIFVASDGVESFIQDKNKALSPIEVFKELSTFKNTKGQFMLKRARRALKEWEAQGITHYDDLSIGCFLVEG